MLDWQFDDFLDCFDLLVQTTNHIVSRVRNLLNLHKVDKRVNFAWHNLVQQHTDVFQSHASVRLQLFNVDLTINVNDVLLRTTDLDQTLLLSHHFAHLSYLRRWLQKKIQLILEVFNQGIHLVSLSFKPPQIVLLLMNFDLQLFDL